jgi:hypothetical protein
VSTKYDGMTVDELDAETVRVKAEQPAKMRETLRLIRSVRDPKVSAARARDRMQSILISQGNSVEDAKKILEAKGDAWALDMVKQFEGLKVGVTTTPEAANVAAKGQ